MGLAQQLQFKYSKKELLKLVNELGYKKNGDLFVKKSDTFKVELAIEPFGLYIHRSGEYFHEFGKLIESLGNITEKVIIEDQ